jgi:hypothetical protein
MLGMVLAILGGSCVVMAFAFAYVGQVPPAPLNVPVIELGLVLFALGGGVAYFGKPAGE